MCNIAAVKALRKKERQDEIQFTMKIGGKTSLGPSYVILLKFAFPVTRVMPHYVETGPFSLPPNRETLQRTLLLSNFY